jgi:hypothetical protein
LRSHLEIPGVVGAVSEPDVVERELARRELRDQDRTSVCEPLDRGGIRVSTYTLSRSSTSTTRRPTVFFDAGPSRRVDLPAGRPIDTGGAPEAWAGHP